MENLMKRFASGITAALSIFAFTACNGNSQTAATTATTATSGYYLSNGLCYANGTTTQVSTTYCTSSTSGYYLSNGICYKNGTTTQVSTTYCTSSTSGYYLSNGVCYANGTTTSVASSYCGTTTTTTGQICLGTFYDPRYGMWGTCNGANCHGVYLYNQAGSLVYCQ